MLGHASAAVTFDGYADLFDDALDGVAAALDRAARQSDVAHLLPKAGLGLDTTARQERENPRMTGGFSVLVTPAGFEPALPP